MTRNRLDKPVCRRDIPAKIDEAQFPELFADFYREFRDFADRTQDDLKEIHNWMDKKDRASRWLRKAGRSIFDEFWQKLVTAGVAAVCTWLVIKFLGL